MSKEQNMNYQPLRGALGATESLWVSRSLLGGVARASLIHGLHKFDKAYLPVIGLLGSLCLQVVLLVTGELRKWTGSASVPGWLAYVLSDIVAAYLLGMLSRTQVREALYGLWGAFLIYHLGGPDNFTAYERADSELWIRHLLNLILQVSTASYVIAVNTRGWILLPTLMVFFIAVERYWERNLALRSSSRRGINKQVKNIFDYMEMEHEFAAHGPSPVEQGNVMLEYFVAGDEHWAKSSYDQKHKRSGVCHQSFVTTADAERELVFSSASATRRACWLTVASASSKAYLRRFIGLARVEQFIHQVRMRTIWFEQRVAMAEWLHYMEIEQEFLYNYLYTKSTDPERPLIQLWLRILESFALVAALVLVYIYAQEKTWLEHHAYKVVTYLLLVVGFVVEMVYVMRLFFSKGAVVAMLVTLVRTQRAAQHCYPWARKYYVAKVRITRLACAGALHISMFMDPFYHKNRQYLPRSLALSRVHRLLKPPLKLLGISVPNSQRGWDMFCLTLPKGVTHEGEIQKVQAGQTDALNDIFELLSLITQASTNRQDEPARAPSCMPGHSPLCCNTFLPFYSKDWVHVLVTWFIATLKLLRLERLVQLEVGDIEAEIKVDGVPATSNGSSQLVALTTITATSKGHVDPGVHDASNIQLERARNKAVWAMMYVCRLLTSIPELLPTQLDYTKELVELEFAEAELDIKDMKRWVDATREEVAQWPPQFP